MSDFEKTYTLAQQTPLIHFQHDEDGATLRATEVKPKLDRFLIERLGKDNVLQDWFVKHDKDKGALDYKMRFKAEGKKISTQIADYKFYFGNMGDKPKKTGNMEDKPKETGNSGDKPKETVFYQEHSLTVVCFHRELMEKIDDCIEDFFILHNFGTRQTKGFGGFLVSKRGDMAVHCDGEKIKAAIGSLPYIKFTSQGTVLDAFNNALTVYGVMKGGFNQTRYQRNTNTYLKPQRYIKGFIQRDYLPDNTGSDKSFIKQYVRTVFLGHERPAGASREPSHVYSQYRFVRALLGLADHYEFRDDMRTDHGEKREVNIYQYVNVTEHNQYQDVTELNQLNANSKKGIERFASPILIKIIPRTIRGAGNVCDVYFIFRKSWEEIIGKTFILAKAEDVNAESDLPAKLKTCGKIIRTPTSFDPGDFLRRFIEYYDSRKDKLKLFPKPYNYGADITLEGGNLNA